MADRITDVPVPPAERNPAGEFDDESFVLKRDQAQQAEESHHKSTGVVGVPNLSFVGLTASSFGLIPGRRALGAQTRPGWR